jgi:putative heme transporter
MTDTAGPGPLEEIGTAVQAHARPGRPAWVTRVVILLAAVGITYVVFQLVGRIDWPAVGNALEETTWWQLLLLLVLLLVRQVLNSVPLALYTPKIGIGHAMMNDMGAMVMACVAPPPSDFALRIAMFSSWGVPTAIGLTGTVMNMITFYIVRFATPLAGFVALVFVGQSPGIRLLDLLWVAASVLLLVGVLLVVRSDGLARSVGSNLGRVVRRVRRHVDPQRWAESCAAFRDDIADRFYRAFPGSLLSQAAMIVVDLTMVVLCLRFVGISADQVGIGDVAVAYLFAYPFTIFPFSGMGVVDALLVAGIVEAGGHAVEAPALAALIVWRVFTVGGVIAMGAGCIGLWRHGVRTRPQPSGA